MPQPTRLIGSVDRALAILAVFDDHTPELGTTEIARSLGLHKSTVASLVHTLYANGYLEQNPRSRKYRLGLRLVERAAAVLGNLEFRQAARPYMAALHSEFDETVNLGVLNGPQVVYVERLLCTRSLGMWSEVGKRILAHSSALGKAILAFLPFEQVEQFVRSYGLPSLTQHTITQPDSFLAELARTSARGFAIDNEENEVGGRCVAAAIFDHSGQPVAAVSMSAPVFRLPDDQVPVVGQRIRQVAGQISASLGHRPSAGAAPGDTLPPTRTFSESPLPAGTQNPGPCSQRI